MIFGEFIGWGGGGVLLYKIWRGAHFRVNSGANVLSVGC